MALIAWVPARVGTHRPPPRPPSRTIGGTRNTHTRRIVLASRSVLGSLCGQPVLPTRSCRPAKPPTGASDADSRHELQGEEDRRDVSRAFCGTPNSHRGRKTASIRDYPMFYLTQCCEHYTFRRKRRGLVGMMAKLRGGSGEHSIAAPREDAAHAGPPRHGAQARGNLHCRSVSRSLAPTFHDAPRASCPFLDKSSAPTLTVAA